MPCQRGAMLQSTSVYGIIIVQQELAAAQAVLPVVRAYRPGQAHPWM